jgi:hypothetical protein
MDNFDLKKYLAEGMFSLNREEKAQLLELEELVNKLNFLFNDVITKGLPTNPKNIDNLKKIKEKYISSISKRIEYLKK